MDLVIHTATSPQAEEELGTLVTHVGHSDTTDSDVKLMTHSSMTPSMTDVNEDDDEGSGTSGLGWVNLLPVKQRTQLVKEIRDAVKVHGGELPQEVLHSIAALCGDDETALQKANQAVSRLLAQSSLSFTMRRL